MFLLAVAGSVLVGWGVARLFMLATLRVTDVPSSIVLQFVGTFGVWLLADHIGLSGVLTMVVYGIVIARTAPAKVPARLRVPSYAVWETAVFVLNVMAFLLIGLQLRPIWSRLSPSERAHYTLVAAAVVVTTIGARFAWVGVYILVVKLKVRLYGERKNRPTVVPRRGGALVVAWCGMRGIVTLAAALALPQGEGRTAFPYRDLIELCAFSVVFATLVLQGFTLRPLLSRLKLEDDGCADEELNFARTRALQAALDVLKSDESPEAGPLRAEYEAALRKAKVHQAKDGEDRRVPEGFAGDGARRNAVSASRAALVQARNRGDIGDEAFHRVEEDLDWLEMSAGGRAEAE
jgi:CPA1 family monovalent cation:H+ antiporter